MEKNSNSYCSSVGLNRTSRPVPVVREISNVRIPDFRFFSFPDSGLIRVLKLEKSLRFIFCHFEIHFLSAVFLWHHNNKAWCLMPAALKFSLLFLKSNCQVVGRGKI